MQTSKCGPRDAVVARLAKTYSEVQQSWSLGTNNAVFEVFVSDKTESWTIRIIMSSGLTCLVESRQTFKSLGKDEPLIGDET